MDKRYVPAPSKPDFFDTSVRLIGGTNPYGESMLEVGWGWDLTTFRNGNPKALKYPGPFLSRFILEKWLPPSFFGSKKEWEKARYFWSGEGKKIDSLGEYPSRGMYGMVMPMISPDGAYMPCSNDMLLFIQKMEQEFQSRTWNVYSSISQFKQLQENMAKEEEKRWAEPTKEETDFEDYVLSHQEEINKDKLFSFPTKSLWTPEGELSINQERL